MLFWSENCLIPTISPNCQQMSTATLLVHRSPFNWYSGKTRFWQKDLLWFLCKQIASFSLFIHRSVNKMRNQLYVYVIKDTLILWHKVSLFWQPWNGMNITTSSILNKLLNEVLGSWRLVSQMGNWTWVSYDETTKYSVQHDMVCINVEKEIHDHSASNSFKTFFTLWSITAFGRRHLDCVTICIQIEFVPVHKNSVT